MLDAREPRRLVAQGADLNATIKNLLLWMVILVLIILAWNVFKTGAAAVEEISFSASERSGEAVTITAQDVRTRVGELAKNADLTKFIL